MTRPRALILLSIAALMLAGLPGLAATAPAGGRVPAQAPPVVVSVQPFLSAVPVGGTTVVNVNIENPVNLVAFEIQLDFEPAVIQIDDSDPEQPGAQVGLGSLVDGREYFAVTNQVDNGAGVIHVAVTLLGAGSAINEDGTLLTMTVRGAADGASPLALTSVALADTQANMLAANLVDGVVVVGADITITPEPTPTPTATSSPTATATARPTDVPASATASPTATPTEVAPSATPSATATASSTPTQSQPTATPTSTPTPSGTPTDTVASATPGLTATASGTPTGTQAAATPTPTSTSTSTPTPTTTVTSSPEPAFTQHVQLPLILRDFHGNPTPNP